MLFLPKNTLSQEFIRLEYIDIKSGSIGSASWCDFNADGYKDIYVTGQDLDDEFLHVEIQLNDKNKNFYDSQISNLPKVIYDGFSAGDIDNNGTLDIIFAGTQSGFVDRNITKIFKSIVDSVFVEVPHLLPYLSRCCLNLVDLDNDGFQDIFYQGIDSTNNFTSGTWKNMRNNTFTQIENSIENIAGPRGNFTQNSALWIDFDNNGLKDALLGQSTREEFKLCLYENKGNFNFEKKQFVLPDLNYISMDAGDINQDGLMDIVLAGSEKIYLSSGDIRAHIYVLINNGDFSFTEHFRIENIGVFVNSLELGDLNNDGYLDLMYYGAGGSYRAYKLFLNDKNSNFYEIENSVGDVNTGGSNLGDMDNDNDLDLLVYGEYDLESWKLVTYVFENRIESINQKPSPPSELDILLDHQDVILKWNNGNDDHTHPNALSYNLRIGTTENPNSILSSFSTDSALKVCNWGNQQQNHQYILKTLDPGHYTIGIQSIDNSYNASVTKEVEFCINKTTYLFGDTISFCEGEDVVIDLPDHHLNYSWSNGSNDSILVTNIPGLHTLNLTHTDGCLSYESLFLKQMNKPILEIGNDTSIFLDEEIELISNNPDGDFLWNDSTLNNNFYFRADEFGLGDHIIWLEYTNQDGCKNKDSLTISVLERPVSSLLTLNTFPNPFFNQINIESSKIIEGQTNLKLYDVKGKLIYNMTLPNLNTITTIQCPELSIGTYYLSVENDSHAFFETFKLVKQYKYKTYPIIR